MAGKDPKLDYISGWTDMKKTLDDAGFAKNRDYFVFTYNGNDDPRTAADGLQNFIKEKKMFLPRPVSV